MKDTGIKQLLASLLACSFLATGAVSANDLPDEATLYKDPRCDCCTAYAHYLETQGVRITIVDDVALDSIKKRAEVPKNLASCHTLKMGKYWIEGHVPKKALATLFSKQPDINGIGLVGMPKGSPGMPGAQEAPFKIYEFKNNKDHSFMTF